MIFRDRSFSILLICAEGKFNNMIDSYLPYNEYYPVRKIHDINAARRELLERAYDIIIINWAASDNDAKKLALDVAQKTSGQVLLMVKNDLYEDIYFDVVSFGVACIPRQINTSEFGRELRMLCSALERQAGEKKKQRTVEDKMAEIRLVNKAKWALIEKKGMSEDEAHKFIEHLAMNQRITRREAAEKILIDNK